MHYLDLNSLKENVPSIFAEKPHEKVSKNYTFIPTTKVIDILSEQGWLPTKASQTFSRKDIDSNDYKKHLLRFRNEQFNKNMKVVGDTYPEIVLINSHNATSSFRFHVGLFRLVCSNGLVVATKDFGNYRIRHQNYDTNKVINVVSDITTKFPIVYNKMSEMGGKILSEKEVIEFGKIVSENRWGEDRKVDLYELTQIRRQEDVGNDLWRVFNRVQENLLMGGVTTTRLVEGKEIINKTRPIRSIDENIKVNQMLWELAEEWL